MCGAALTLMLCVSAAQPADGLGHERLRGDGVPRLRRNDHLRARRRVSLIYFFIFLENF